MKIFKYISVVILASCLTLSCSDFLNYNPSDQIPAEDAIKTPNDVKNAVTGLYNVFGNWPFMGRNIVALGDIGADNAWMTGSSGHYDQIYRYTVSDDSPDLLDIWTEGYIVANGAAKIIKKAPLILKTATNKEDENMVKKEVAQAYALKAMAQFYLVNIFGLPYNETNKSKPGIIIIKDEPILAFQKVNRGTIGEVYSQILADIAKAKENIALDGFNAFTVGEASLTAFEARVNLYMQNWAGAKANAQKAISLRKGKIVTDPEEYKKMWSSVNATSEDIFTISKSADDNLSANSLNTLYGAYNGKLLPGLVKIFAKNDMRKKALIKENSSGQPEGLKYQGLPSSKATSNIPIIRLPEMYLILAEAKAQLGESDAVNFVFEIAKRNPDLKKTDIPTDKAGLLKFIASERRRELFQEGHRWFDARRTGEAISRDGGISIFKNWDISKFVYPIPVGEINASGLAQNDKWENELPKIQ